MAGDRTHFGATAHLTKGVARAAQREEIEDLKDERRRLVADLVAAGELDPLTVMSLCLEKANMHELDLLLGECGDISFQISDKMVAMTTRAQLEDYATRLEEHLQEVHDRLQQLPE